ncbi:hypothetical protein IKE84_02075 [Candidatus Saccharibacteria bacterium]|nr:hypothetical protein [Candidatus Saccharibacteria bacterium]
MTKILNGKELASYIKERQAHEVRSLRSQKKYPKLMIIRDSDNPVIIKYVNLKKQYGKDINIDVIDQKINPVKDSESLAAAKKIVQSANDDNTISGIIIQLPITDKNLTDDLVNTISPTKDVDGLNQTTVDIKRKFESATATAITWLLSGYGIELDGKKVALVGYGKLVGKPLKRIFDNSNINTEVFRHNSDLTRLTNFDVIISATGVPHLITNSMLKPGAIVVDAGTASENGVLVGDIDESVRNRNDLTAITPKIGGVGPLTITALFDNVIHATTK